MPKKILQNIKMGYTWNSYIDSADAVLKAAGLWEGETWLLLGMTGMAFHFIVEKNAHGSSVTIYDWANEHYRMMDRIGIITDNYSCGNDMLNTIGYQRDAAIKRIKESIDNGIAVVAWAPSDIIEFGVIFGYDDDDGVFFVKDMTQRDIDPLLYENLGKSRVPALYYQLFRGKTNIEETVIFRQSLLFGISQWEMETHPNPGFANGRKGYENLISFMSREKTAGSGFAYIIASYGDSKRGIADYFNYIAERDNTLKDIDKAARIYENIRDKYAVMTNLFPCMPSFLPNIDEIYKKSSANIPELLKITTECFKLEEEAMGIIKKVMEQ